MRKNEAKCALATCAQRMYRTEARVYMSRAYIKSEDGTYWTRYTVSGSAQREITAFDRGAAFEPGIYRLAPPSASQRMANGRAGGGYNSKTPTGKVARPHHITFNVRRRAPVGGIQK
jgi:hypothetical protein